MTNESVLVTGGAGLIAGHCILQLLQRGYQVRATLRSLASEKAVRAQLARNGMVAAEALTFVAADLTCDDGWADAVRGIDYVLHVASPMHTGGVADENQVIGPARDGTLRVLRAARDANVTRVVLTSAFHAVGFGHGRARQVFTERDWSVLDGPGMDAYGKSKIVAERAAWDFVDGHAQAFDLVSLLPVAVMGPVLGDKVSGANSIVQRMLSGAMPGLPRLFVPVVDVRDVATAHLAAMTASAAARGRFLICGDAPTVAMTEIASTLKAHFGPVAERVPTRTIPDIVVRLAALVRPEFRSIAVDLNYAKQMSNQRAREVLGLDFRSPREAIIAAGESILASRLVDHG